VAAADKSRITPQENKMKFMNTILTSGTLTQVRFPCHVGRDRQTVNRLSPLSLSHRNKIYRVVFLLYLLHFSRKSEGTVALSQNDFQKKELLSLLG
jgi:hypothetical protein